VRFKPTLILLAIAVVALGYYFLVEQPRHKRGIAEQQSEQSLTDLTREDVFGVVIDRPNATLMFNRLGSEWRMKEPVNDQADQASVNMLVHTAVYAQIERQFAIEAAQLAEYGLAEPAATIKLSDSVRTNVLDLAVGEFNLSKTHCYAMLQGSDEVLLLPAGLRRYVLRDVFEFRDKRVADFPIDDVVRLDIDSDENSSSWTRLDKGRWVTHQTGDTIRADRKAIGAILSELRGLRATEIIEDNTASVGRHFDHPAGAISIHMQPDSLPLQFVFSQPESGKCYIRSDDRGRIDVVPASAADMLARTLQDLRDRHVLHFDRERLAKIVLDTEKTSISIVKLGPEWSFANPTFGDIDQAEVAVFLNQLEGLKYREIIEEKLGDAAPYGLDPPAYRLTLFDAEERVVDVVTTGPTEPGRRIRYATSRSSPHLGIVDAEPFDEIEAMFDDFQLQ
jgi:hypothetical protein